MNRVIVLAIGMAIILTAGIFLYKHVIPPFVFLVSIGLAVRLCTRAGYIFNKKGIR